jgi:hypothetical protein
MKLQYIIQPDSVCQYHRQLTITNIDWPIIIQCAFIHCSIEYGNLINKEFVPLNLAMYPNYSVKLIIANSTLVDLQGRMANETPNPELCVIGEYDFFIMGLEHGVPLSEILENGINVSILRGRHNV